MVRKKASREMSSDVFALQLNLRTQLQTCAAASVYKVNLDSPDWCAIDQRSLRKFIRDTLRRKPVTGDGAYLAPNETFGGGGKKVRNTVQRRGDIAFKCLLVGAVTDPDTLLRATYPTLQGALSDWLRSNMVHPGASCECLRRIASLSTIPELDGYIYTKILGRGSFGLVLRVQHVAHTDVDVDTMCKTVKIILGPSYGEQRDLHDHTPQDEARIQRELSRHEITPRVLTNSDVHPIMILGRQMHVVVMEPLDCTMSDYLTCIEAAFPGSHLAHRKARESYFAQTCVAVCGLILRMRSINVTHMDMHTSNVMFRLHRDPTSTIGAIVLARVIDTGQLATGKHDPRTDVAALLYGVAIDITRTASRRYFERFFRSFLNREYLSLCQSVVDSRDACHKINGDNDMRLRLFRTMSHHVKHGKNVQFETTATTNERAKSAGTVVHQASYQPTKNTAHDEEYDKVKNVKVRCTGRTTRGSRCRRYTLYGVYNSTQLYRCYSHNIRDTGVG